jgi:hypothetical protein
MCRRFATFHHPQVRVVPARLAQNEPVAPFVSFVTGRQLGLAATNPIRRSAIGFASRDYSNRFAIFRDRIDYTTTDKTSLVARA